MIITEDIQEFLMFELGSVGQYVYDMGDRCYAIVTTIAAVGNEIQESHLKLLLSNVAVDRDTMDFFLGVFSGMEMLYVQCDCAGIQDCFAAKIKNGKGFFLGEKQKAKGAPEYLIAKKYILDLVADMEL